MPSSIDDPLPPAKNERADVKMEELSIAAKICADTEQGSNEKNSQRGKSNEKNTRKDSNEDEGVEVVLDSKGGSNIVNDKGDQNVFRLPQAVRPRVTHAPYPPHYPPYSSGSWGYGPPVPPPPHHMDRLYPPPPPHLHGPYPVPPYAASSGSFEVEYGVHHPNTHYSPHIQYPAPPRYGPPGEEVNVISPNHRVGDPHYRPPITPRPNVHPYYQYPPTSPVSRPGQGRNLRNYAAIRRDEHRPYPRVQDGYESRPWEAYGPPPPPPPPRGPTLTSLGRPQPTVVAESFDSSHRTHSHPSTPKSGGNSAISSKPLPTPSDPHMQLYGGVGSFGSFDSSGVPGQYYEDQRYHGFPPDSPYSPYQQPYSPSGIYRSDSFPPPAFGPPSLPPTFSYTYEDEERLLHDYHPDQDGADQHRFVTPTGQSKGGGGKGRSKNTTPILSNTSGDRNSLLPKAAEEVDFDVTDPPLEPVTPESLKSVCDSVTDVNPYDVLCGRGGGTNSQVGNRRFRQLVQDFQPTYLMAKRKEKPLLARTIVLIIRKRGGRFLKKNEETGELYEVGDIKAEAKTSQALREGLDVRATKSATSSSFMGKIKKPIRQDKTSLPARSDNGVESTPVRAPESPPTLPQLHGEELEASLVHPHSPDQEEYRKRRRMRSEDRFFSDFMPPRADINHNPDDEYYVQDDDDGLLDDVNHTPIRRNGTRDEMDYQDTLCGTASGCAGIALDIVTGAATSSFCLAPSGWRR